MTAAAKQQLIMPVALRAPDSNDLNFIRSSWLKSFQMTPATRYIPSGVYFNNHKEIVNKLLTRSHAIVAAASDDPDHILGYLVYSNLDGELYIHYVYVKQVYRRMKIATAMFDSLFHDIAKDDIVTATHASEYFPSLKRRWPMIYNPYVFERFNE